MHHRLKRLDIDMNDFTLLQQFFIYHGSTTVRRANEHALDCTRRERNKRLTSWSECKNGVLLRRRCAGALPRW